MSKLIDLTGQPFGYWQVIERAQNSKDGQARWLCQCTKCNQTIKIVSGSHLRSGRSQQCRSCAMKVMTETNIIDETGNTYGFLVVKRRASEEEKPRQDRGGIYWVCTCTNCGRDNVVVFGDYLRGGDTHSCGCIRSKNESKIASMLDSISIKYIQQYRFNELTLTGLSQHRLAFDFGIIDNNNQLLYLIEFDGIQHFSDKKFWGKEDKMKDIRKRDLVKNRYCFEHNIPLIRIPYNESYILEDLKLETTRFLLTPENEEKYYQRS